MCLTKLDYLLVTQAIILDEDDNLIEEMPGLPVPLQPATLFQYQTLLMNKPVATNFRFVIQDPNTGKNLECIKALKQSKSIGMFNSVVSSLLKDCGFRMECIKALFKSKSIEMKNSVRSSLLENN